MKYLELKKRAISGGGWWVSSSCLAAYRFRGAASAADALLDMSGNGYHLTRGGSAPWTANGGFNLNASNRYLNNSSLNGKTIRTIIIRYSGLTSGAGTVTFSHPNSSAGLLGRTWLWTFENGATTHWDSEHASWLTDTNTSSPMEYRESNANAPASGILGGSASRLYLDGSSWSSSSKSRTHDAGSGNRGGWHGDYTIGRSDGATKAFHALAAAFYSEVLSAEEHALIAANMALF